MRSSLFLRRLWRPCRSCPATRASLTTLSPSCMSQLTTHLLLQNRLAAMLDLQLCRAQTLHRSYRWPATLHSHRTQLYQKPTAAAPMTVMPGCKYTLRAQRYLLCFMHALRRAHAKAKQAPNKTCGHPSFWMKSQSHTASKTHLELKGGLCLLFCFGFPPGTLAFGSLQPKLLHCVVHSLPA